MSEIEIDQEIKRDIARMLKDPETALAIGEEQRLREECLINKSHLTVANLFMYINYYKIVISDDTMYFFNLDTMLYDTTERKGDIKSRLAYYVQEVLDLYIRCIMNSLQKLIDTTKREDDLKNYLIRFKKYRALLNKIGDVPFITNVANIIYNMIWDKNFYKQVDIDQDVTNFRNGLVDLRTGEFRERTFEDQFSKALDYDYFEYDENDEECKQAKEYVEKIFRQIANNADDDIEALKEFFGYCLTGSVELQVGLWSVGFSASNGKTTLAEIFRAIYDIYVQKVDNRVFEPKYPTLSKTINDLRNKRYAYIEEVSDKSDSKRIKDWIGCRALQADVLYSTTTRVPINCKFNIGSNKNPKVENDNGIARRGLLFNHESEFLEEKLYEKRKDEPNVYLINTQLVSSFEDNDMYKLAFFQMLLPYAKKFYVDHKLPSCVVLNEKWREMQEESDPVSEFLELYYSDRYEDGVIKSKPTDKDMEHKDDILRNYQKFTGLKNIGWETLLGKLKSKKFTYNSMKMVKGRRGFIIGLKYNEKPIKCKRNIPDTEQKYDPEPKTKPASINLNAYDLVLDKSYDIDTSSIIDI